MLARLDHAARFAPGRLQSAVLEARHARCGGLLAPYSRLIRGSFSRNAQHFLETGFARAYPAQAVLAQALHAAAARVLAQVGLRGAVVDQAPGFVVDEQQLENPCAALIARERARLAAARGEQGGVRPAPIPVLEKGLLGAVGLVRAPARRAQPPHQPLRENAEPPPSGKTHV